MSKWISVGQKLPDRNRCVYAMDDKGNVFDAIYFGPAVGWVNVQKRQPVYVTHWADAVQCR